MKSERLFNIYGDHVGTGHAGNVWDTEQLAPTIDTCGGGNRMPLILDKPTLVGGVGEKDSNGGTQFKQQNRIYSSDAVALWQSATESFNPWYAVAQRKREEGQTIEESNRENANAITTVLTDSMVGNGVRIRKLTPLECWRLMGFDDEDLRKAEKVCSNTQLYKQAGNSIAVPVLENIFKQLL